MLRFWIGFCNMLPLLLDTPITFGVTGTARRMGPIGFDFDDNATASWTVAVSASLTMQFKPPVKDLVLRMSVTPYLRAPTVEEQQFSVYVNGLLIDHLALASAEDVALPLPRSYLMQRETRLTLVIPTARRPKDIGGENDARRLGLLIKGITFATA